ncbi:TIGR00730 family Rossman fold protein [Actinopolymorpha sp. NPDC004070]|uniref:LOG family protein n=1 Tax=Actinopolymorpha sp. NPDC004070 TaxID=3154548 RepID=UPI0033B2DFAE
MRRIAVFTGSTNGNSPTFATLAYSVGEELARREIGLVYGGGRAGLMGELSQGALDAGGEVIGVIPQAMVDREWARTDLTDLRVCATMHERKAIMADNADAFLALPGGLGTLEEIFEVWTWRQLGFHRKPVGFLNAEGFWQPLLDALHGISSAGFLSAVTLEDVVVDGNLSDVLKGLSQKLGA